MGKGNQYNSAEASFYKLLCRGVRLEDGSVKATVKPEEVDRSDMLALSPPSLIKFFIVHKSDVRSNTFFFSPSPCQTLKSLDM